MSASGFTPIQLFRTTTATAAPTALSLADGELAINLTDEKLYFKNAAGVVKLLASNAGSEGTVTSVAVSGGTTGLTTSGGPITSSGTITLGGTLAVANGGTGVTTSTGTGSVVLSNSPTLVTPTLGAASATSIANGLGAVGTPSYTFTGDTNTGMWSPSADALAFSTGGSERVRVASDGNIAIGTATTADWRLRIEKADAQHLLLFNTAGNGVRINMSDQSWQGEIEQNAGNLLFKAGGTTERMRITNTGNVGIGVTAPDAKFRVAGSSNSLQARFSGVDGRGLAISTFSSASTSDNGVIYNAGVFSDAQHVWQCGGTERMRIDSSGRVGIGTNSPNAILTVQAGSVMARFRTGSATDGRIEFAYNTTDIGYLNMASTSLLDLTARLGVALAFGAGGTERMRIDSSGNVGIGTSSPTARLTLQESAGSPTALNMLNRNSTQRWALAVDAAAVDDKILAFIDQTNSAVRMAITDTGNVGIGTTSPGAKLHVSDAANGKILISGTSTSAELELSAPIPKITFTDTSGSAADGEIKVDGNAMQIAMGGSERARIDSSGNLLVGLTATPSGWGAVPRASIKQSGGATTGFVSYASSSDNAVFIGHDGTVGVLGVSFASTGSYTPLVFQTGGTERMRIDSSGNLMVGRTSIIGGVRTESSRNANANYSTTFTTATSSAQLALTDFSSTATYATPAATLLFGAGDSGAAWSTISGVRESTQSSALTFATASGSSNPVERARIDSSGNLLVGTTSSTSAGGRIESVVGGQVAAGFTNDSAAADPTIVVWNKSATGPRLINFRATGSYTSVGTIESDGTSTIYGTSSDARLKENIAPADDAAALIDAIQVRKFDWMANGSHQRYGMIAQELVEVAPEAVSGDPDGEEMMGVDYSKLVPMLVKEIQQLRARVAQLEGN